MKQVQEEIHITGARAEGEPELLGLDIVHLLPKAVPPVPSGHV